MSEEFLTATATVADLSTDGRGVVRVNETVYFVSKALPGDTVEVQLDSHTKPPSASVLRLIEPSPHRIPHPCAFAGPCCGSLWGSLAYDQQLLVKRNLVERTLHKSIGDVHVLPAVPSPQQWHYRNRISLRVWETDQKLQLGFVTEARSQTGVAVSSCQLAAEDLEKCLNELSARVETLDPASLPQIPRRVQIHQTASGAGLLLVFVGDLHANTPRAWEDSLRGVSIPGGLWFASGSQAGVIHSHVPVLHQQSALPMQTEWQDYPVEVHPAAFCQANGPAADRVGERIRQLSGTREFTHIYDLYGGFGALGLAAARNQQVSVFESSIWSERSLMTLARQMNRARPHFVGGDLLHTLPDHIADFGVNDLIILDPPRSGVHPDILEMISDSPVHDLYYLSCNPARLARDLAILKSHRFEPIEIQPYDFFPQTPSIEVLAILHR